MHAHSNSVSLLYIVTRGGIRNLYFLLNTINFSFSFLYIFVHVSTKSEKNLFSSYNPPSKYNYI